MFFLCLVINLLLLFKNCQAIDLIAKTSLNSEIYYCLSFSVDDANFGCSSAYWGTNGEIYVVKNQDSLDLLLSSTQSTKYVILLYSNMLLLENLIKIEKSEKIAGIIVLWDEGIAQTKPTTLSFESTCPNSRFDYYKDNAEYKNCSRVLWNPSGQNLIERSYRYPMALLKDKTKIEYLLDCYENNQKEEYKKCGIRFETFMTGYEQTTTDCTRRNKLRQNTDGLIHCHHLVAQNIYAPLRTYKNSKFSPKYIVVSVKLDTRTLFIDSSIGAESEVSSIIVFLSALKTISQVIGNTDYFGTASNIIFIGFDGEGYDFIGSSIMGHEMLENKLSIPSLFNNENISYWLDIGPVALADSRLYYQHTDPIIFNKEPSIKTKVNTMSECINRNLRNVGLSTNVIPVNGVNSPLPPSSLQKILAQGINVPGIYFSDSGTSFKNKFYHGFLDDPTSINVNINEPLENQATIKDLTLVTTGIVRAILELSGGNKKTIGNFQANSTFVSEISLCLLKQSNCSLFSEVLKSNARSKLLSSETFDRHCVTEETPNSFVNMIRKRMAYDLGEKFPIDSEECKDIKSDSESYNFRLDDICVKGAHVYSYSQISPYFQNEGKYSQLYPSWVMSGFNKLVIDVYHIAPTTSAVTPIILGSAVTILCLIISISIRKWNTFFFS